MCIPVLVWVYSVSCFACHGEAACQYQTCISDLHIVCCEYVLTWYAAWLLSLGAVPLVSFGKGANLAHCMNVMFHLTRLETRTKESNTCANLWVIIWGVMKMTIGMCALIANQSTVRGLCLSMCIRTRKMVNYAWVEWIQGKLWRKLVAVLTCKSFVILEYRGERLIEPSSSWFPLKFLSG